ncbi:MAG TPA: nucleotide exchange factor GrpE [Thermodesulfovibrionales bacterium]|nr:nucleotide exchange factor GrpE [Thermodesulfovibrionales bacterium]
MENKDMQGNNEENFDEDDLELVDEPAAAEQAGAPARNAEAEELNNKYLRLYADFENYRKRVNKDREDLVRYGNESLLYELLPAIDNLELAMKHASGDVNSGLVQGVEVTLKELQRTLEKFGLTRIEAEGRQFDPAVHHAMSRVERTDIPEQMVAQEFRAGYRYRDKVLRPSLVAVSVQPQKKEEQNPDSVEIKINNTIEEEE